MATLVVWLCQRDLGMRSFTRREQASTSAAMPPADSSSTVRQPLVSDDLTNVLRYFPSRANINNLSL
jgi:hypothetical protein